MMLPDLAFRWILFAIVACLIMPQACRAGDGAVPRAGILHMGLPGEDASLLSALEQSVRDSGYSVVTVSPDDLSGSGMSDPALSLLVFPNAAELPGNLAGPIESFARSGGDILALRTPMWSTPLVRAEDGWVPLDDYQRSRASHRAVHPIFDFAHGSLEGWGRSADKPERSHVYEVVDEGPATGIRSLHCTIGDLSSWDTLHSPDIDTPFPNGNTLTVFSARGGPNTGQLVLEWTEKDGSRWLATVSLTPEWRQYVLRPEEFRFWQSVPGRGGAGDGFKPANAARFTVGLAFTHMGPSPGSHEYWFTLLGTDRMQPAYESLTGRFSLPAMDTLSPVYKLFDCSETARLSVAEGQAVVAGGTLPLPSSLKSPHPRPAGGGFDKGRKWRFIPLLQAETASGEWRGTPATLTVNTDGPLKGGMWASFGIQDAGWYGSPLALKTIGEAVRAMRRGVFIVDGGANFYTYFDDQTVTLGVNAANVSLEDRSAVAARVTVTGGGEEVWSREWVADLKAGETKRLSADWKPKQWPDGGYLVEAELLLGGKVIDRVSHEIHVWRPKPAKQFVTVKDGDFQLGGKRWRPVGINYMPSSGIATEDGGYFENWIGARSYDPDVIQRDLEHIRDIGLNSISIFIYHDAVKDQNLLDLLRRADLLGLKANLSLRPGTPINFLWPQMREIIEHHRLRDNDTVFAYDLAWEPMFGSHTDRVIHDREWEEWIVGRYGSVARAEADWGFAVPRDDAGQVTNPLPHHVDTHGAWNRMTAAYRRFLDTLLYKRYGEARRLVRSVDPNHMVSFRMAEAGNPDYRWDGRIPYDWPYLAAAVEIIEPEAYGRIGDYERTKPGRFTFEYARCAGPELPMLWAEMGVSAWETSRMLAPEGKLRFQADFYRAFYRMLMESGADGVFHWWYPGGFRYGENSDYGIINADGSDRPVTAVLRELAPQFAEGPDAKSVDTWLTFDRDEHPDGIAGIYDELSERFWKTIEDGGAPGLRTAGTGTTSADCPPLAVGNTRWNGSNPPKYLDGAFDFVEVRDWQGRWVRVTEGSVVPVERMKPVQARAAVTNLAEATWLRRAGKGAVCIVADGPQTSRRYLWRDVERHGSVTVDGILHGSEGTDMPIEVTLTFEAAGRTRFGEKVTFRLEPR